MRVLAICGGLALLYGVPNGVRISVAQTLPWTMACILPCYVAGLSLSWHTPRHPVSRRLLAAGSFAAIGMAVRFMLGKPPATGWHSDTPREWAFLGVARTFDVLAAIMICRLVALLPDGRVRHGYERVVLRSLWLLVPYPVLLMALPISDRTLPWLLVLPESWAPGVGAGLLLIRSLLAAREQRAGRAPGADRVWVIALIALVVFAGRGSARLFRLWLAGKGLDYFIGSALGALPYITISAGLVYAAFRHRLPGMDFAIRRSLVYGVLWTIIGAWYLGMTTALGLTAGQYLPIGLAVLVAVTATMLFQPVHRQLNRLAARRVFGARPSNFELLVQCGTTLEHAYDLKRLGPQLAVALREGLDLRWVRVRLGPAGPGRVPFGSGSAGADTGLSPWGEVRLRYGDEVLGSIEYGPKEEGRFSPEDQDVIETLARQAALAVHNALLTAELSTRVDEVQRQACELNASRTRIVQAQDTERRRIERQLHDGIQQELVALVAKLALARNQLCRNGDTVHTTLTELQDDACRVIDELREVAHGIHPPVLTDQGLAAAVISKARRLPIPVAVEVDPSVSSARFAPEIEEAAFFLVSEALTNVLKHARADGVTISIARADGSLFLDVSDDGVGLPAASRHGSGLTGMRDRIEAVGGRLSIAGRPGGGTTLRAQLTERSRETAHA